MFSLHLFAYLASWGMLRGSSFILYKDYLFHNDVVKELLNSKYDRLISLSLDDMTKEDIVLIFELRNNIRSIYYENTYRLKGEINANTYPSDTLVSKIILGTLGCCPAYDRFFIDGMKSLGVSNRNFTPRSLSTIQTFYLENHKAIIDIKDNINSKSTVPYPTMKIMDMIFWKAGYDRF